jgi:nucleotide-binding universal stress UspA family protein
MFAQVNGTVYRQSGLPGEVVLNAANQKQATMIVMGTRGLGLLRRTVLGSVSEYVLNHTNIPLTVVPNPASSEVKAAKSWLSGWW